MPTIISHSIIGIVGGKIFARDKMPKRFWVLSTICPVLPGADVVSFAFGIPYNHFFGHRGFFHSIPFAFLLSVSVISLFFRNEKFLSRRWWLLVFYFFFITGSHGILDAFTNGGCGVALLSPFDDKRYFFPWTPINVSPIGIKPFFSKWGLKVLLSEFLWVWLPLGLLFIFIRTNRNKEDKESKQIS